MVGNGEKAQRGMGMVNRNRENREMGRRGNSGFLRLEFGEENSFT